MRYLILIFFSDRAEPFNDYQAQTQIGSGPFAITPVNLACIVICVVVLLGVALLLQRTRIGKAMRAVATTGTSPSRRGGSTSTASSCSCGRSPAAWRHSAA